MAAQPEFTLSLFTHLAILSFCLSISISNRMWICWRTTGGKMRPSAGSSSTSSPWCALWAPAAAAGFWRWVWRTPRLSRQPGSPGGEAVSSGQAANPRRDQQEGWGLGSERTTPLSASADDSPLPGSPVPRHIKTCCPPVAAASLQAVQVK